MKAETGKQCHLVWPLLVMYSSGDNFFTSLHMSIEWLWEYWLWGYRLIWGEFVNMKSANNEVGCTFKYLIFRVWSQYLLVF